MSSERDNESTELGPDAMTGGRAATDDPQDQLTNQARLARDERAAALRALAGRLAHQIRNPLAAIRAACSGLRSEVEDADQQETLDLALIEIDKMLGFVTSTVQTIPSREEARSPVTLLDEIDFVVAISRLGSAVDTTIRIDGDLGLRCVLPPRGLRVAIFSVLDHLAATDGIDTIDISTVEANRNALIRFAASHGSAEQTGWHNGFSMSGDPNRPVGLLVAERFARDMGGCLLQTQGDEQSIDLTLQLPCTAPASENT